MWKGHNGFLHCSSSKQSGILCCIIKIIHVFTTQSTIKIFSDNCITEALKISITVDNILEDFLKDHHLTSPWQL